MADAQPGRRPLVEDDLEAIERRANMAAETLRTHGMPGESIVVVTEDVPQLLAEIRRAQQVEEQLYEFMRQKGMGMELQRFQEQRLGRAEDG